MSDTLKGLANSAQQTVEHGISALSEGAQQKASEASRDANKEIAKDPNAGLGTRAQAAIDSLKDGIDAKGHEAEKEAHKKST